MSISHSRRMALRHAENTQQLIVFRVLQAWFALPIQIAYKVISLERICRTPQHGGVGLTYYQHQEVLILDLQHRIFGEQPSPLLPGSDQPSAEELPETYSRHLLLIQTVQGDLIGLPLNVPPVLRRVPKSAFAPVSSDFLAQGNMRCVSALVVPSNDEPPIFLLNPHHLIQGQAQTQPILSSTTEMDNV